MVDDDPLVKALTNLFTPDSSVDKSQTLSRRSWQSDHTTPSAKGIIHLENIKKSVRDRLRVGQPAPQGSTRPPKEIPSVGSFVSGNSRSQSQSNMFTLEEATDNAVVFASQSQYPDDDEDDILDWDDRVGTPATTTKEIKQAPPHKASAQHRVPVDSSEARKGTTVEQENRTEKTSQRFSNESLQSNEPVPHKNGVQGPENTLRTWVEELQSEQNLETEEITKNDDFVLPFNDGDDDGPSMNVVDTNTQVVHDVIAKSMINALRETQGILEINRRNEKKYAGVSKATEILTNHLLDSRARMFRLKYDMTEHQKIKQEAEMYISTWLSLRRSVRTYFDWPFQMHNLPLNHRDWLDNIAKFVPSHLVDHYRSPASSRIFVVAGQIEIKCTPAHSDLTPNLLQQRLSFGETPLKSKIGRLIFQQVLVMVHTCDQPWKEPQAGRPKAKRSAAKRKVSSLSLEGTDAAVTAGASSSASSPSAASLSGTFYQNSMMCEGQQLLLQSPYYTDPSERVTVAGFLMKFIYCLIHEQLHLKTVNLKCTLPKGDDLRDDNIPRSFDVAPANVSDPSHDGANNSTTTSYKTGRPRKVAKTAEKMAIQLQLDSDTSQKADAVFRAEATMRRKLADEKAKGTSEDSVNTILPKKSKKRKADEMTPDPALPGEDAPPPIVLKRAEHSTVVHYMNCPEKYAGKRPPVILKLQRHARLFDASPDQYSAPGEQAAATMMMAVDDGMGDDDDGDDGDSAVSDAVLRQNIVQQSLELWDQKIEDSPHLKAIRSKMHRKMELSESIPVPAYVEQCKARRVLASEFDQGKHPLVDDDGIDLLKSSKYRHLLDMLLTMQLSIRNIRELKKAQRELEADSDRLQNGILDKVSTGGASSGLALRSQQRESRAMETAPTNGREHLNNDDVIVESTHNNNNNPSAANAHLNSVNDDAPVVIPKPRAAHTSKPTNPFDQIRDMREREKNLIREQGDRRGAILAADPEFLLDEEDVNRSEDSLTMGSSLNSPRDSMRHQNGARLEEEDDGDDGAMEIVDESGSGDDQDEGQQQHPKATKDKNGKSKTKKRGSDDLSEERGRKKKKENKDSSGDAMDHQEQVSDDDDDERVVEDDNIEDEQVDVHEETLSLNSSADQTLYLDDEPTQENDKEDRHVGSSSSSSGRRHSAPQAAPSQYHSDERMQSPEDEAGSNVRRLLRPSTDSAGMSFFRNDRQRVEEGEEQEEEQEEEEEEGEAHGQPSSLLPAAPPPVPSTDVAENFGEIDRLQESKDILIDYLLQEKMPDDKGIISIPLDTRHEKDYILKLKPNTKVLAQLRREELSEISKALPISDEQRGHSNYSLKPKRRILKKHIPRLIQIALERTCRTVIQQKIGAEKQKVHGGDVSESPHRPPNPSLEHLQEFPREDPLGMGEVGYTARLMPHHALFNLPFEKEFANYFLIHWWRDYVNELNTVLEQFRSNSLKEWQPEQNNKSSSKKRKTTTGQSLTSMTTSGSNDTTSYSERNIKVLKRKAYDFVIQASRKKAKSILETQQALYDEQESAFYSENAQFDQLPSGSDDENDLDALVDDSDDEAGMVDHFSDMDDDE